mmetsp:Transcript_80177/g.259122  ORF Transcript_80177/g.259122 Transcript_80177/m.259122 type:complete len:282 (-) Transcript_80177:415-1260(-)
MAFKDWQEAARPPYHHDAMFAHLTILQYYDVPQLSVLNALQPLTSLKQRQWLKSTYFADAHHPTQLGHMMAAQVVGFWLKEEEFWSEHDAEEGSAAGPSTQESLPLPLVLPQDVADSFALSHITSIDLRNGTLAQPWILQGNFSEDWDFGEDVPGKPGLISTKVGARLVVKVPITKSPLKSRTVNVGLLKSYANMGIVSISLVGPPQQQSCNAAAFVEGHTKTLGTLKVDCMWSAKASVYDVVPLQLKWQHLTCVWIVFEVLPSTPPRSTNKVKLIDINVL